MNQVISAAWRFSSLPIAASKKIQTPVLPSVPSFPLRSQRQPTLSIQTDFMMRITVDAAAVAELRRVIVSTCGDLLIYMRVKPVDHASKMKFWLCLSKSSIDAVIGNIMRALPQAEFGRITPLLPPPLPTSGPSNTN
jgi:hypothetical protein